MKILLRHDVGDGGFFFFAFRCMVQVQL